MKKNWLIPIVVLGGLAIGIGANVYGGTVATILWLGLIVVLAAVYSSNRPSAM